MRLLTVLPCLDSADSKLLQQTLFRTRTAGIWSPSGSSASRLRELLSSSTKRVTLGSGCTTCTEHRQSSEQCIYSIQDK